VDAIQKWGTVIGAVIAVSAFALNLRSKSDKIKIDFGPTYPPISPGESLHVLSCSDHRMKLKDYGFIDRSGAMLSLPALDAFESRPEDDHVPVSGSSSLEKRGDIFEIGPVRLRDKQIGAYAITVGQRFRRTAFHGDIGLPMRLWLKIKIAFKPKFQ